MKNIPIPGKQSNVKSIIDKTKHFTNNFIRGKQWLVGLFNYYSYFELN